MLGVVSAVALEKKLKRRKGKNKKNFIMNKLNLKDITYEQNWTNSLLKFIRVLKYLERVS